MSWVGRASPTPPCGGLVWEFCSFVQFPACSLGGSGQRTEAWLCHLVFASPPFRLDEVGHSPAPHTPQPRPRGPEGRACVFGTRLTPTVGVSTSTDRYVHRTRLSVSHSNQVQPADLRV